jgi:uracil-DNA glycosylase
MKALFTFFLLFTITLVSAQDVVQDSISIQETKRPERTKTITVGPFTGIKLFSGIQVKLIPSNENKLVFAGENFADKFDANGLPFADDTDSLFDSLDHHAAL